MHDQDMRTHFSDMTTRSVRVLCVVWLSRLGSVVGFGIYSTVEICYAVDCEPKSGLAQTIRRRWGRIPYPTGLPGECCALKGMNSGKHQRPADLSAHVPAVWPCRLFSIPANAGSLTAGLDREGMESIYAKVHCLA